MTMTIDFFYISFSLFLLSSLGGYLLFPFYGINRIINSVRFGDESRSIYRKGFGRLIGIALYIYVPMACLVVQSLFTIIIVVGTIGDFYQVLSVPELQAGFNEWLYVLAFVVPVIWYLILFTVFILKKRWFIDHHPLAKLYSNEKYLMFKKEYPGDYKVARFLARYQLLILLPLNIFCLLLLIAFGVALF